MKTSNSANNQRHGLSGISISRYPATRQGFSGPEFPPLFPNAGLLKAYRNKEIGWAGYTQAYQSQLDCLNCERTYSYLNEIAYDMGADEPILLCYESAKTLDTQPCHRRLVAEWFERELGVRVPEWSKQANLLEAA